MAYLLIRVHSFECDEPGCVMEEEHAEPRKADALQRIAESGWEQAGVNRFFCPKHAMDTANSHNRRVER